jgi:hypothetical protein
MFFMHSRKMERQKVVILSIRNDGKKEGWLSFMTDGMKD